jgi:hypothetical protein
VTEPSADVAADEGSLWPQALRVVLLVGILAALGSWLYTNRIETPLAPIQAHVALVQAGDLKAAHATLSTRLRSEQDLAAFGQFVEAHPQLYRSTKRGWYALGDEDRAAQRQTGLVRVVCAGLEAGAEPAIFQVRLLDEGGARRLDLIEPWTRD